MHRKNNSRNLPASFVCQANPRRGLSREEAAIYFGISPSKFDELRKAGRVGPPKLIDARKVWDIARLDQAFDAFPEKAALKAMLKNGTQNCNQTDMTMPQRLPTGCVEDIDRHGNIRIYFRSKGQPKVRLRSIPWTEQFMEEYAAAKASITVAKHTSVVAGTWRWLVAKYISECTDYKLLDRRTQNIRRLILESTCQELIAPDSSKVFADFPLSRMGTDAIEVLRDRKLSTPEAANSRVKAIRQVFRFAVKKKIVTANPARDVEYIRSGSQGYHTWTTDEVRQYEQRHPVGTKARLALALLLLTGQRRSDVVRFGRQHVRNSKLTFTQYKGRNKRPKTLTLPIIPALRRIIDATPCGELTFVVTDLGRPFSDAGFGNKFRDWCNQAGLKHCTAHGLRKAGATIAANNGATSRQLMSMFGWDTLKEAERYTRAADQARLAESAMHLLEIEPANAHKRRDGSSSLEKFVNKRVPLLQPVGLLERKPSDFRGRL